MAAAVFPDPNWRPPVLVGPRVTLRPLVEDDADSLFAAAGNPNVTRFTLWEAHRSRDDSLTFLRTYVPEHYRDGVPDPLGIVLQENGPVLGCVGCHWASEKNRAMEFGYWIAEPFWRRGFVIEAARLLIDYVFANYDVERVQAHCFAENAPSARALEKLGLTFEGTHRSALFHRGRFWDLKMYAVLRGDWISSEFDRAVAPT
jgi:[ribosomal protein S5]-alanine N-acetyltransferase